VLDIERGKLDQLREQFWQTDTSIGLKSWGYIDGEKFRSADSLIDDLIDIVSKNGNLLLNIGPRSDGTIPEPVQQVLREIGGWLKVNGEAIYGTRPWRVYGEGPTKVVEGSFHDEDTKPYTAEDFRFTTKGETLYAIELAWPAKGEAVIRSLPAGVAGEQKVASVELIGSGTKLVSQQLPDGLHIRLPEKAPGRYAFAFRIRFAGN